jgi:hypothetical protein
VIISLYWYLGISFNNLKFIQMVSTFKKIGLAVLITVISVASVHAQTIQKKTKPTKHHCTAACANGKHVYAHGEKKHVCTAACMKMEEEKMALKDHVCTAACKDGNHQYAHGEKGHVCTEACKSKM